ncbi:hypothetical protein K9L97_00825 [Candidatus Woesearchaeota archaeon]|nr:hypothetical protein [Candidatus Woesearchaeota archaeon]
MRYPSNNEYVEKMINIVIFGGTGDLTKRKLAPALNNLATNKKYKINLIGVGRTNLDNQQYEKYLSIPKKNKNLKIQYFKGDVSDKNSMKKFYEFVHKEKADQTIYYLATSYNLFDKIFNIVKDCKYQNIKLMIEKPFGSDYNSWEKLNKLMKKYFTREQIYKVDHYVAKQTIDNILRLRLSNPFFENIWNSKFIDKIKIVSKEINGVEQRLEYYDGSGAIKDMIQNHLLQTASLILMDPPKNTYADEIRYQKTRAIKKLEFEKAILGQYEGYEEEVEKKLGKKTKTETYSKIFFKSKSKRWENSQIILETGKKMNSDEAYIELEFKKEPCTIYCDFNTAPNKIRIDIQPRQNISLTINAKMPGETPDLKPVQMLFCPTCEFKGNTPTAYETIIDECIKGEKRLFIRATELNESWKLTDKIINKTKNKKLIKYKKGSESMN